ncbi:hypothetical protein HZP39_17130 [Elizabethkingia anophelis]|uniref:hypothetical protein n=1 Tax=Elizabethkingia anophelis TaxID=1117645 RepID=UPI0023E9A45B|nr:hypothetical protein [Elizabethkingia anophelis]MCT4231141.1 hypothetical protein [Elizabethkingia anophelis]MCT4241949.1 hypothetical protein [Elizabethkingia anophelis]MCT4284832.1 hypothetical protein [Elizabethkingia anophelis]MCT4295419.1 hypothetical protein [Elizabethkingia anophelis]GJN59191.1 hypothetical protein ELAN_27460 [Elizabethkingia anophelis]
MLKPKYNLDFPSAHGKYWILLWIGKIRYHRKQFKVELHFINKTLPNDELRNLNLDKPFIQLVPIVYLADFRIGSLYDTTTKNLIEYISPGSRRQKIPVNKQVSFAKREFPLIGNPYFLKNASSIISSDFRYLMLLDTKHKYKESSLALISPYCILQYFFNSDRLIKKALKDTLLEGFKREKAKKYYDSNSNERIVELEFDQNKLTKKEAFVIAPYLFLKNDIGTKFIKSVGSYIFNALLQKRIKGEENYYLDFKFDFSSYVIECYGKEFYNKIDENKKDYYTLIYQINKFDFIDKSSYTVDKILLIPFNSTNSTKDRDNHELNEVNRPLQPTPSAFVLLLDHDSASPTHPGTTIVPTDQSLPFRIKVEILKRKEQLEAYKVNWLLATQESEGIVRDLENLDNAAKNSRENLEREIAYLDSIPQFEHFNKTIDQLELIDPIHTIVQRDPLGIGINSYPMQIESLWIIIVEVIWNTEHTYLIEFGKGFIGVFNHVNYSKITADNLNLLLSIFERYREQAHEEKKSFWTYINLYAHKFQRDHQIIIQKGVEHTRMQIEGKNDVFIQTAKRIYKTRIVNKTF